MASVPVNKVNGTDLNNVNNKIKEGSANKTNQITEGTKNIFNNIKNKIKKN